jgi:hypothetical protein
MESNVGVSCLPAGRDLSNPLNGKEQVLEIGDYSRFKSEKIF